VLRRVHHALEGGCEVIAPMLFAGVVGALIGLAAYRAGRDAGREERR
jgi:hypothetical protein